MTNGTRTDQESETTRIAVVTDSTACIPQYVLDAETHLHVVSLMVIMGDVAKPETPDIAAEVVSRLRTRQPVSTSQPSPEVFAALYQELSDGGVTHIVSIHLSEALSGTADAARTAAANAAVSVEVIDSASVGMGLGFAALAAARAARFGADAEAVASIARKVCESARVVFFVDSLDHLRRGGRLGSSAAAVGTVFGLRPLLEVRGGEVAVVEKVRSRQAAISRLESVIISSAGRRQQPVIAVQHLGQLGEAIRITDRLEEATGHRAVVSDVGAVLAAHAGPGVIAMVVADIPELTEI